MKIYGFYFDKFYEKKKQAKIFIHQSEHTAVIFLLHGTNAGESHAKEDDESGNGDECKGLGIAKKPEQTADKGRESGDGQRLSKRLPVRFLVFYLRLVIIVDEVRVALINGKTDRHEQNGDGEHNNGIE